MQQIKSCRRQLHRPNKLRPSSALAGLVLKIDVRQRLRVAILHDGPRRTASKIAKTPGVTRSK